MQLQQEFTDSDGKMALNAGELDKNVICKYDVHKRIGKGAYGIVWKAVDKRNSNTVAVKKIFDAFRNQTDAQRTFREVLFLKEFGNHPNIVKLLDVMKSDNNLDLYLVFEHMETDLHNVIKKGNVLKDVHKRFITYQLLKAIKYIHSGNVIHRDHKPSNILLDSDCQVKLADFGLARSLSIQSSDEEEGDPTLTEYVATRWYRAPEILLSAKQYTKGVDMWSLGCILGEMLLGKAIFPGTSTLNQIERIMSAIQPPTFQDIRNMCSGYAMSVLERATNKPKRPLRAMLANAPEDALDLLTKLLVFSPQKRLTAEEALKHPYVSKFHDPDKEIALSHSIIPPVGDDFQLSVDEYRNQLYKLVTDNEDNNVESVEELATKVDATKANLSCDENTDETATKKVVILDNKVLSPVKADKSPGAKKILPRAHSLSSFSNNSSSSQSGAADDGPSSTKARSRPPAGLPSRHPQANGGAVLFRFNNPVILRDLYVADRKATQPRIDPSYRMAMGNGKRQFGNHCNVSSLGSPKVNLRSFSQSHGTISASAFQKLRSHNYN